MGPGALSLPALIDRSPELPTFLQACLPEQASCGFGIGADQLYGSAGGEFIERYSAGYLPEHFDEPLGNQIIPATDFMPFTEEQYSRPGFTYTHPSLVEDLPYIRVRRAVDRSVRAVPADLVHLNPGDRTRWCSITSNGLGAGRSFAMAARAAVFELIERDGFMRAWYGRRSGATLRIPDTIPSHFPAALRGACRQLELQGVTVTLVRLEGPAGLPVILSCARSDQVGLAVGCSAKADIRAAMTAAFVESLHTYNWGLSEVTSAASLDPPIASDVESLQDHIAFHARPANRALNEFLDSGPEVTEAEFVGDHLLSLPGALLALEDAGWQVYLADVRSPDVAVQGWHVIRALSPQAATLDVDEPHLRQHPGAVHTTPHPFP
ncbi:YcaO-like family protein [Arthrobacter sp. Y-9]|uniref:YcaO-like family protein n=1 Tax=Arthrobacter sp. Y-9 TaxID=3039385 RepID=UPI00241E7C7D|nr:YcaO-like family protein [Arthrobacter sp. Y-9]WFR85184.1 YcaO-like family protein [Arthrobacter sp. Y-9]